MRDRNVPMIDVEAHSNTRHTLAVLMSLHAVIMSWPWKHFIPAISYICFQYTVLLSSQHSDWTISVIRTKLSHNRQSLLPFDNRYSEWRKRHTTHCRRELHQLEEMWNEFMTTINDYTEKLLNSNSLTTSIRWKSVPRHIYLPHME